MPMSNINKVLAIALAFVLGILVYQFVVSVKISGNGTAPDGVFGAIAGMLAEDYIPYVRYNEGYKSGLPIDITSTLDADGATALGSTLSVTGATTLSSTLAATGATTTLATTTISGNYFAIGTTSVNKDKAEQAIDGSGTTTLKLYSSNVASGGCIEMRSATGTLYRIILIGAKVVAEAGTCK